MSQAEAVVIPFPVSSTRKPDPFAARRLATADSTEVGDLCFRRLYMGYESLDIPRSFGVEKAHRQTVLTLSVQTADVPKAWFTNLTIVIEDGATRIRAHVADVTVKMGVDMDASPPRDQGLCWLFLAEEIEPRAWGKTATISIVSPSGAMLTFLLCLHNSSQERSPASLG